MLRKSLASIVLVAALALIASAPASATTFCVPGYFAACPNSGGNVAQASLDFAMTANGEDGVPDKVFVDAFTYTDPDTLQPNGTDPLEIVGAGTSKTILTTNSTGNIYVMDSGFGGRELTVKDLTIRVPESVTGASAALLMVNGHLENVDIETRHPATGYAIYSGGDLTYEGGRIYGTGAGNFDQGVATYAVEPGALELDGVTIDGAARGLVVSTDDQPVTFTRGRIRGGANSVLLLEGGRARFENSVIEGGSNSTFVLQSGTTADSRLDIDSSTIIEGNDPAKPAISGTVLNVGNADSVRVNVRNSIFRGFNTTFALSAPANLSAVGNAYISFTNSNFNLFGTRTGDGSTYIAPSNINQDPKFSPSGDYSLTKGSPSIDAGDPFATDPSNDILGRIRPIDGDVNGSAIRDQGAYEFVPDLKGPPPTCETDPTMCPDKTAPKITKVKFKHGLSPKKGGTLKLTLSEAAKLKATFKPTPVGKGKKKRKTLKLSKAGKVGANTLKVKKKKLKPGKYKLVITATDAAGNKSTPFTRKVKVKPAGASNRERR